MSIALPWREVQRRITVRIDDLHRQLESAAPDDCRHLQGQIAALRFVEAMPKTLPDPDNQIGDSEQN